MVSKPRKADPHRFYERALTEAERADFAVALDVEGIDGEVALLRTRLIAAVKDNPGDVALMLRGFDVLRRLVVTKYGLSHADGLELGSFGVETLRRIRVRGEGRKDDDLEQ